MNRQGCPGLCLCGSLASEIEPPYAEEPKS